MNNAKEIKVHDTVWVNLKPFLRLDDDAFVAYAKVLHIEEDKNEGVTYYDVCFRGSGAVFCGVEDYCVHPIASTEAVLPKAPKDNGTTRTDKEEINVDDEPGETSDMIHHPDHYTWKGTECKKVIEIMTRGLSGAEPYYMGNIIKYLYRYPAKGTAIKDLMKARQYLDFLITTEEVKEKKRGKDK
ncbi:DUF3310 domain-containing protein [uncultured Megasphaera sp.]|uniref:DUF3310 domain-containing protein n=1 Tax=uncultured Megasphaera sp. TaxID=165188 RepID=UPI00258C4A60|nr:DUF3310 domain-containing protein [uncultured Megasphaera sp.]